MHNIYRCRLACVLCLCSSLLVFWVNERAWGIDYGTPVPEGQYSTVGLVTVNLGGDQTAIGTGTLISSNVVLTAAHVIQDAPTPGHISFRLGAGGAKDFIANVIVYRTHPGYLIMQPTNQISDDERNFLDTDLIASSASDVALLLLDHSAVQETKFYQFINREVKTAENVTAVGFGLDERMKTVSPRKLQGTLEFLKEQDGSLLFRTPKGSSQRTDHGDSGGPLFIDIEGQTMIAAITHGYFTSIKIDGISPDEYGIYVSMTRHHDWIADTLVQLSKYKLPTGNSYFLARSNRRSPFMALTARQLFSLANADTPGERLVGRTFSRGLNEPIPEDVATGLQKRYSLPPGMLSAVKSK